MASRVKQLNPDEPMWKAPKGMWPTEGMPGVYETTHQNPFVEKRASRRNTRKGQNKPKANRKPLRKVSENKARWLKEYSSYKKFLVGDGCYCLRCSHRGYMEMASQMHHPFGQQGALILCFVPLCANCHHHIHFVDPKAARAEGWLRT